MNEIDKNNYIKGTLKQLGSSETHEYSFIRFKFHSDPPLYDLERFFEVIEKGWRPVTVKEFKERLNQEASATEISTNDCGRDESSKFVYWKDQILMKKKNTTSSNEQVIMICKGDLEEDWGKYVLIEGEENLRKSLKEKNENF